MKSFETYLKSNGINFKVAKRYSKVATKYLNWLEENNLNLEEVKRSNFTDWLQTFREQGFKQCTLDYKENVIRYYYYFLGCKHNPAISWVSRQQERKLPPTPLDKADLLKIYNDFKPITLVDYRNRCMLGFVIFQALQRNELEDVRINDLNFKTERIFVQGQIRNNSRSLKLDPLQKKHLQEYCKKYRVELLANKTEDNDQLFISSGYGKDLEWGIREILKKVRKINPQVKDLYHIRTSLISHWRSEYGLLEAMIMCGHKHASSTRRYETKKYDDLQEKLRGIHPLERIFG